MNEKSSSPNKPHDSNTFSSVSIINDKVMNKACNNNNQPNEGLNSQHKLLQFIAYREGLSLLYNRIYFPLSMMRKLRENNNNNNPEHHSKSETTNDSRKKDDHGSKKVMSKPTNISKMNTKSVKDSGKKTAVSLVAKDSSYETVNYVVDGPCIVTLDNTIQLLSSTWVVDDVSLNDSIEDVNDQMNTVSRKPKENQDVINSQSNVFICDSEESNTVTLQFLKEKFTKSIHQCSRFSVQNIEFCSFDIENATEITLQSLTPEKNIQQSPCEISGMKLLRFHSLYLKLNCIIYYSEKEIYRVTSLISKSVKTRTTKSSNNGIFRVVSATKINLCNGTDSISQQDQPKPPETIENIDDTIDSTTSATESCSFYFESKSCKELLSLLKVAHSFFHHITLHASPHSSSSKNSLTFTTPYSILIHGPHNIGKTSTVKNIAKKLKYPLIYVNCNSLGGGMFGNEQAISSVANRIIETAQRRLATQPTTKDLTLILFLDDLDKIQQSLFSSLISIQTQMEKSEMKTLPNKKIHKSSTILHFIIIGSASSDCEFMKKMEMRGKFQREVKFELPSPQERTEFCKTMYSKMFAHLDFEKIGIATTGYQFYDLIKIFNSLHADRGLHKNIEISTEYVLNRMTELHLTPSIKKIVEQGQECEKESKISILSEEQASISQQQQDKQHHDNTLIDFDEKHWDKIGGLSYLKQKLRQAAEWPMKYPESFKRLGLQPPLGILLYGPPGTGKVRIIISHSYTLTLNVTYTLLTHLSNFSFVFT